MSDKARGSGLFQNLPPALARRLQCDFVLGYLRRNGMLRVRKRLAADLGLSRKDLTTLVNGLIDAEEPLVWVSKRVVRYDFARSPLTLTVSAEQMVTLVAALRYIRDGAHTRAMLVEASQMLHRIAGILPEENFKALRALGGFDLAERSLDAKGQPRSKAFLQVEAALSGNQKLRFLYTDANGVRSDRVVWPLQLTYHDSCLVAWCEARTAFRTFRISNMAALEVVMQPIPQERGELLRRWRETLPLGSEC